MKYKKLLIEKLIVEEATEEELKNLVDGGYSYEGQNYFLDRLFEKTILEEKEEK